MFRLRKTRISFHLGPMKALLTLQRFSCSTSGDSFSLYTQYIQAEGIFQLSKLSLFHPTCYLCPADMAFFTCWTSTPPSVKLQNAKWEQCNTLLTWYSLLVWQQVCTIPKLPKPGKLRGESLLFTPSTLSWSLMIRRASAYLGLQRGRSCQGCSYTTFRGKQTSPLCQPTS